MTLHTHTAISESGPWPFNGPVGIHNDYNPAAHGNVGYTEQCSCGHERRYLVNGRHVEYGPWRESDEARDKRQALAQIQKDTASAHRRADAIMASPGRRLTHGYTRYTVDAGAGIRLELEIRDERDLYRGDTAATLHLSAPWHNSSTRCTLGVLRQAARDWADAPGEPAHDLYTAIAAVLP